MSNTRRIVIVGGGQAGLQLGIGLLDNGYDVEVVQNRTAEQIRDGRVLSSQCMFDAALQNERDIGLNFWDDTCPTVDSINFVVPAPDAPSPSMYGMIGWLGTLREKSALTVIF